MSAARSYAQGLRDAAAEVRGLTRISKADWLIIDPWLDLVADRIDALMPPTSTTGVPITRRRT